MTIGFLRQILGFIPVLLFLLSPVYGVISGGTYSWDERIVLVKEPGKPTVPYRTVQYEERESSVILETDSGKKMGWQLEFVLAEGPAYPADAERVSDEVLERCVINLQRIMGAAGEAAPIIQDEISKFDTELKRRRDQALNETKEKAEEMLATWNKVKYSPTAQIPVEKLEEVIQFAGEITALMPEFAERLEPQLTQMKEHLVYMEKGLWYWDGEWVKKEDIVARYEEKESDARNQFFENEFAPTLPAVAIPAKLTLIMFGPGLLTLSLFLILFLQAVISRSFPKGIFSWIIILLMIGMIGLNVFFLSGILYGKKSISDVEPITPDAEFALAETSLGRAIFLSSEPEIVIQSEGDSKITLIEADVNQAILNHLLYEGAGTSNFLEFERRSTGLFIENNRLSILDEIFFYGKPVLMQTHLEIEVGEKSITFGNFEIIIGDTALPGFIAAHAWQHSQSQILTLLSSLRLGQHYGMVGIEEGQISLMMTIKPNHYINPEEEIRKMAKQPSSVISLQ
ncbi:MAG: hypothetical protein AAFY98_06790 [Verrucomicrobiota bacterium]